MLLIYFIIFILQNKIQSIPLQENAEIELTIFCYENKQPIKYCDSGYGYRKCEIKLHFCVSNIYKEDSSFDKQWCDLFDRQYQIKNTKGMCKKGKHDTRGKLRKKMNFTAFLQNKTKIFLHISLVTEVEKRPVPKSLLSHNLYYDINKEIIPMSNEDNISEELINVKLQRKITCLKNFHGNFCEKYCINPNDISLCKIKEADICTKDWFNKNCSHSEFKEKINQCNVNNRGNCKKELKDCLNILKCEKLNSTINKASMQLSGNESDKTDPYLKFLVKVITIIGGGLLVIIFILLATVLLMWKVNKREVIRVYRNSIDHIHRYSLSRQNIPLPTVGSRDSNYCNIDSSVESYIRPTKP